MTERKTIGEIERELALCASRVADTDAVLMATRAAEQQCLASASSTARQTMCAIAVAHAARARAAEAVVALYDVVDRWRACTGATAPRCGEDSCIDCSEVEDCQAVSTPATGVVLDGKMRVIVEAIGMILDGIESEAYEADPALWARVRSDTISRLMDAAGVSPGLRAEIVAALERR